MLRDLLETTVLLGGTIFFWGKIGGLLLALGLTLLGCKWIIEHTKLLTRSALNG